jgi:antitoxin component YwqK of YwqJK toxin-antitoxin module
MKKTFMTPKLFYKMLWIFGVLLFLTSCKSKQKTPKPIFDLNTPGSEVVASFEDNTPQVIFYYKVDESGNQTHEQIGVAEFYPDQQERLGGGLKEGKRNGQWYAFFPDGSLQVDAFYIDGIEHGAYTVYRENGNPYYKGHYDHGICNGTWRWYDETGKQIRKVKADKNTIACEYCRKCLNLK